MTQRLGAEQEQSHFLHPADQLMGQEGRSLRRMFLMTNTVVIGSSHVCNIKCEASLDQE